MASSNAFSSSSSPEGSTRGARSPDGQLAKTLIVTAMNWKATKELPAKSHRKLSLNSPVSMRACVSGSLNHCGGKPWICKRSRPVTSLARVMSTTLPW